MVQVFRGNPKHLNRFLLAAYDLDVRLEALELPDDVALPTDPETHKLALFGARLVDGWQAIRCEEVVDGDGHRGNRELLPDVGVDPEHATLALAGGQRFEHRVE